MPRPLGLILGVVLSLTASAFAAEPAPSSAAGVEWFETKVRPVLAERCYQCHSAQAKKLKGKLRLDTVEGIRKGGDSGMPAVEPGKPDDSLLVEAIRYELDDLQMPPKGKLTAQQIKDIEAWVKMGAPLPKGTVQVATTAPAAAGGGGHPVRMTMEEGRKFWSFRLPVEPKVPEQGEWGRNEVDRFVLAKLKEKGLKPAPEADRRTLIRRATYDLTGLPPTAEEVEAFEKDASPDAYEKVVDRLLASPRYGERWGRHWLDVARYADTKGYVFNEERRYAFSYTYRDWVIRAFNEDLPYDQFLIDQIAADRLDLKEDKRPLAALGFLTLGRRFINNQADIIDDRIDVVCRGTMGLTVACARCHDHKYDPIPTADYYSLYGVFASSTEPKELPLLGVAEKTPEAEAYQKEHARLVAERDNWLKGKRDEIARGLRSAEQVRRYLIAGQRGLAAEAELPFDTVDDGKALNRYTVGRWQQYLKAAVARKDRVFAVWRALVTIPADRFATEVGPAMLRAAAGGGVNPIVAREICGGVPPKSVGELAGRYAGLLAKYDREQAFADDPAAEELRQVLRGESSPAEVKLEHVARRFNNAEANKLRELQNAIDTLATTHPGSPPRAMAMEDLPQPVTPHIFRRGNPANPGEAVPRRFLEILSPAAGERQPFKEGSGRLKLARAIASKDNPLTARVMVNRVWQWHFGYGLVRTPSDFGSRGELPTHPELLDWLALRFENEDGWSVKRLQKRIMLSAVYRQASWGADPKGPAVDPENRLLWRFNPQRLDFEEMRDSLLAAAGRLDLTEGGRSVDILAQPFSTRRTVYAYVDRQNLPGVFRTFDFASPDAHVAARAMTSVPQQALFMMNSPFVIEQARKLAGRAAAAAEPRQKVTLLYRAALGREPTAQEVELGVRYVQGEEARPKDQAPVVVSAWQYGYGAFDEGNGRVKAFQRLPHFTGTVWQGGAVLPDPKLGWAMLSPAGGHVGNDGAHAVVRRWTAPRDCTVAIDGTLAHHEAKGDGVRGRIVTSREGCLATWVVHGREADTKISPIAVKKGDTIDFVVDCGAAGRFDYDSFAWQVTLTKVATPGAVAGDDTGGGWDSAAEFAGPAAKPSMPMNAWERLAQVLLESNEFMFVD